MTVQDVVRQLPDIPVVRDRSRSLAMLDAILCPEWEYRYYSFDAEWGPKEELALMRNGSGDDYAIVFSPVGAWVRVFDHESPMSPWALERRRRRMRGCGRAMSRCMANRSLKQACDWRRKQPR